MEDKKQTLLEGFKLTIDNHSFNVSLATHIGLTEAILLQHFYFMYCNNIENEAMQKDGKTWFFRSVKSMNETYPYLTTDKIRGAIERLVKGGLVFKADYNADKLKRVTWYTLSDDVINMFSMGNNKKDSDKTKAFGKIPNENVNSQQDDNKKDNINKDEEYKEPLAASDETPTPSFKVSYKEIVDKYNTLFNGKLPKVTAITDKRKKAIKARVTEFGIESIDTVFNNIAHSDFLLGRNDKNWQCDFDWIFRPTSYVKILEGNYKNKTGCIISTEYENAEAGSQIAKCIEWMQIYTPRLLNLKGVIDEEGFERMRKTCKKGEFKKRLEIMNTDESITENMNIVEAFVNYGTK